MGTLSFSLSIKYDHAKSALDQPTNAHAVRCMYCEGRLLHREISHFLPAVEAGKRRRSQTKYLFFLHFIVVVSKKAASNRSRSIIATALEIGRRKRNAQYDVSTNQRPPRKEKEFFGSVAQQRQLATSIRREGGANLEKGIFWAWKR